MLVLSRAILCMRMFLSFEFRYKDAFVALSKSIRPVTVPDTGQSVERNMSRSNMRQNRARATMLDKLKSWSCRSRPPGRTTYRVNKIIKIVKYKRTVQSKT